MKGQLRPKKGIEVDNERRSISIYVPGMTIFPSLPVVVTIHQKNYPVRYSQYRTSKTCER